MWLANGMSGPPLPDLDALSLDELKKLVVQLLVRVLALEEENQQLRAENGRLKDLPKKPKLAPGGMDKATEPDKRARTKQARRQRCKRQSGRRTPPVTEERTLVIEAPAGSRRRGFEPFTVQDLLLVPQVIRFRRERWVTPDGQEIVAPLPPEVSGHFGPGIVRFVLMQHVQGQVTVERLRAQLNGLGVRISKGQIVTILTANKDVFHAEKDAILEAGLATARWVTVDDTAARHAGRDEYTTHIGNDRFAWFATRPSKIPILTIGASSSRLSGAAPVVDTQSVRREVVLNNEVLSTLPATRGYGSALAAVSPGFLSFASRLVASDRLTSDWQLAVVPTRPEYWMATPTECRPLLSRVVSSTIQCSMAPLDCIAGTTRPSTRSRTGPSLQLASLTKCWIAWCRRETFPLSRRSAIGSMLLRSPGSSSPVM